MNLVIPFAALLFAFSPPSSRAELPKAERDQVVELMRDILPPHMLNTAVGAILHPDVAGQDEADKQRKWLAKSQIAIPKLRRLIKIKSSVFDYPGLLSRGFISSHQDYSKRGEHEEYSLLVSATYGLSEFAKSEAEFLLHFDDRGIITGMDDVRRSK